MKPARGEVPLSMTFGDFEVKGPVAVRQESLILLSGVPVGQRRATITNQHGTVVLAGECSTHTLRPE